MNEPSVKNYILVRGYDPANGIRALQPGTTVISLRSLTQPILDTYFSNPNVDASLASGVCHNQQWLANDPPKLAWTQMLDPENELETRLIGASGIAVNPNVSKDDMPFLHPFGNDFEFRIIPDFQYRSLVAPNDNGPNREDNGLRVEVDSGFVPKQFRCDDGDRVAVFGRWIADCGHTDFHTEIHPPLLLASARPKPEPIKGTTSCVVARPYLVSQRFSEGSLRAHFLEEIKKIETPIPVIGSTQVEAHPKVYTTPFSGVHSIKYFVRPPSPRQSPGDTLLVSFHFTARTGVTVQVFKEDSMTVGVLISMDAASYSPSRLPQKHPWTIPGSDLQEGSTYYWALLLVNFIFGDFLADIWLARDILTDHYDDPIASSVHDSEITTTSVDNLGKGLHYSVDDGQPFPVYGWLDVQWEHH